MQEMQVQSLGREVGNGVGNGSSILAWNIPWKEQPGSLQSMGLKRVGHDFVTENIVQSGLWNLSIYLNTNMCEDVPYVALMLGSYFFL